MNRIIKFRAWDKSGGGMVDVHTISFEKGIIYFHPTHLMQFAHETFALKVDDCELMQYTGLHDKNGKEIYEGDILLPDKELNLTLYTHPKHLVEVVYECGFFGARDLGTRHGRIDGGMMVNPDDWMDTEVIGNIWENKELLEK